MSMTVSIYNKIKKIRISKGDYASWIKLDGITIFLEGPQGRLDFINRINWAYQDFLRREDGKKETYVRPPIIRQW